MFFACFLKGFEREFPPSISHSNSALLACFFAMCNFSERAELRIASPGSKLLVVPEQWRGRYHTKMAVADWNHSQTGMAADPRADTKRSHNNQPFSAINWYLERNVMRRRLHLATMKARERRRTVGIRMKKYQNEPSASARKTSFPLRTFTGIALVPLPNTIVQRPEKHRFLRPSLGGEIGTVPERRISWSGGKKTDKTKQKPKLS